MLLSDYQRYRLFEILPGLVIWATLAGAVVLSITQPLAMIYAVLVFDVYWVLRVIYFSSYVVISWRRFRQAQQVDWQARLMTEFPQWQRKINVVFLPVYNEPWPVLRETLQALAASSYPAERLYVVLSGEEAQSAHWAQLQSYIAAAYGTRFAAVIFYTHPSGVPDELPGKGSNIHYAEEQFRSYADGRGWAYDDIIASVFDVDTVAHPHYLAHLTYMYCRHPNPTRSSFQPVTLYNNNIWDSPAILRIMALGTSFWMLFSLGRLDNLVTFSSHSMSFRAIVDSGGHSQRIVSEDSRIFFQCWLHYGGQYEVTPLYIPVSMDTVRDETVWKSLGNLYFQQRRWAWGTENIPYLLWQFRSHPEIPWHKKAIVFFHEFEGKWSWAVVTLLLTVLGSLPLFVAGDALRQSTLFLNTPHMHQYLMALAMIGLFVSAFISLLIIPDRPEHHHRFTYIYMLGQWLLLPVSLVFFSALPCIDAVTHLMVGKYLGFNVSAKKRFVS